AVGQALIRLDRALPRAAVLRLIGGHGALVGHSDTSTFSFFGDPSALLRTGLRRFFDFPFAPSTRRPARSIKGSRARNMVIAATTPVAASVPGLSLACSSWAVPISRERRRSTSPLAAAISGLSVTARASLVRLPTRR